MQSWFERAPEAQNIVLRSCLSPPVFTVRSGPVWRQDLAILSPEGPRDNTCQLRSRYWYANFHAQYDWTTGVLDNGNEWRKFRVVPRLYPSCVPLFVHCLIRVEAEGLLDYQGRAGIISIVRWNLRPVIFGVENFASLPCRAAWIAVHTQDKFCW